MSTRPATEADIEALAALAALTFPLAAPEDTAPQSLASFIDQHLSAARFAEYLADPHTDVLVHDSGATTSIIDGYALLVAGEPEDRDVVQALTIRPSIMLSKFYVSPDAHGQGVAADMLITVFEIAEARGGAALWLGVNRENVRAQRFYAKQGFQQIGTKRFQVGARLEHDLVLERPLRIA